MRFFRDGLGFRLFDGRAPLDFNGVVDVPEARVKSFDRLGFRLLLGALDGFRRLFFLLGRFDGGGFRVGSVEEEARRDLLGVGVGRREKVGEAVQFLLDGRDFFFRFFSRGLFLRDGLFFFRRSLLRLFRGFLLFNGFFRGFFDGFLNRFFSRRFLRRRFFFLGRLRRPIEIKRTVVRFERIHKRGPAVLNRLDGFGFRLSGLGLLGLLGLLGGRRLRGDVRRRGIGKEKMRERLFVGVVLSQN